MPRFSVSRRLYEIPLAHEGQDGFFEGETIKDLKVLESVSARSDSGRGHLNASEVVLHVTSKTERQALVFATPTEASVVVKTGQDLNSSTLPGVTWKKMNLPSSDGILYHICHVRFSRRRFEPDGHFSPARKKVRNGNRSR
jgi:hypothetical protein